MKTLKNAWLIVGLLIDPIITHATLINSSPRQLNCTLETDGGKIERFEYNIVYVEHALYGSLYRSYQIQPTRFIEGVQYRGPSFNEAQAELDTEDKVLLDLPQSRSFGGGYPWTSLGELMAGVKYSSSDATLQCRAEN